MKANLDILQHYLESRAIVDRRYSALMTDTNGVVKSLAGYRSETGLTRPVVGAPLHQFHPVFAGIFPMGEKTLILPNIETHPGSWWDIHLVNAGKLVWVIMEDKTPTVNGMRASLQDRNLDALAESSAPPVKMARILGHLGYAVLDFKGNAHFSPTISWPEWTSHFFPAPQQRFSQEDLIRMFPYLEVFIDQRETAVMKPVASEIWTQQNAQQSEWHFRAWWIPSMDSWSLVIRKLEEEESQSGLIQKARMVHLEKEEVQKSERLARELVQTRNQFVSIVSHDLRSPFISIISALDYLFEDPSFTGSIGDEHSEFLGYIHEESKRLLDYLEKLLNWTRLDTGKLVPVIRRVSLAEILKLTMTQFEARLKEKEIRFEHNITDDFQLDADPTLFSQVINNLLGNAIKFTPRGGRIRFLAGTEGGIQVLRLTDNGVGIPKEKQEVLFLEYEKYYTFGTEGEKGTGLGLSICKKILDAHGYSIRVISEEGEGTEMRIILG